MFAWGRFHSFLLQTRIEHLLCAGSRRRRSRGHAEPGPLPSWGSQASEGDRHPRGSRQRQRRHRALLRCQRGNDAWGEALDARWGLGGPPGRPGRSEQARRTDACRNGAAGGRSSTCKGPEACRCLRLSSTPANRSFSFLSGDRPYEIVHLCPAHRVSPVPTCSTLYVTPGGTFADHAVAGG